MGCMRDKDEADLCSECGWREGTPPDSSAQLSPRAVLVEKYLIGMVLGQGGFGITYLAWDLLLNRKLAIKEYFPREICSRARDERTVQPLSQRSRQDFAYGLSKFVEEGQNLARFRDYPGIVSLFDFFENNGTAYLVMAYMEGMTFKQYLGKQGGKIGFDAALAILIPVMDALREVHRVGMLHRDISPDNIYLNQDRQVKILDFGATRYAMREQSNGLTVLFKPGYAPLEQYSSGGKQGPWTDVYAVGATFYRALSGKAPSEAPDRLAHDDLTPPSRLGISLPSKSESALLKALAVHWESRFQNIRDFQDSLVPAPNRPVDNKVQPQTDPFRRLLMVASCLLLLTTLTFSGLWYSAYSRLKSARPNVQESDRQENSADSVVRNELSQTKKQLDDNTAELSALKNELADTKKKMEDRTAERNNLQNRVRELSASLNAAQQAQDALKNEANAAKNEAATLRDQREARRLRVVYFELFDWNRQANIKKGPTVQFQSSSTRYVLCGLGGPNPLQGSQPLSGTIEVRYIAPNGTLKYTITLPVTAGKSAGMWATQATWGSDQAGTFERGNWRIEVWSDGQRIASKDFRVY